MTNGPEQQDPSNKCTQITSHGKTFCWPQHESLFKLVDGKLILEIDQNKAQDLVDYLKQNGTVVHTF